MREESDLDLSFENSLARELVLSSRKLLAMPSFSNIYGPFLFVLGMKEHLEVIHWLTDCVVHRRKQTS